MLINIGGKLLFNKTILRVKGGVVFHEEGRERNRWRWEVVGITIKSEAQKEKHEQNMRSNKFKL